MTVISGRSDFATSAAPEAPLPPPIGTMSTSRSGRSVRTSSAAVADAGDEVRLVSRMHVARSVCRRATLALDARVVVIVPVLDDRRAVRAHRRELQRIRVLRHDDRHRDAEHATRVRERLAVVAGRRADDARLRRRIAPDQVEATAHLERRGRQQVLALRATRPDRARRSPRRGGSAASAAGTPPGSRAPRARPRMTDGPSTRVVCASGRPGHAAAACLRAMLHSA